MRSDSAWWALVAAMAVATLYACGGDDFQNGSGAGGPSTGPGSGGATSSTGSGVGANVPVDCAAPPLFETDIVPIFEKSCGTGDDACHSRVAFGADPNFGCRGWLTLENVALGSIFYAGNQEGTPTGCADMDLYTRVTMDAWQCGAPGVPSEALVPYVKPCDPEGSYLVRKMTGGAVGGPICKDQGGATFDTMPPDEQPIQADIDLIYSWIAVGAPTLANPACTCGMGEGGGGGASPGAQNPEPNISHPGDMETRPAGAPVPFVGAATDPQDGDLPASALTWSSDLDGPLNNGNPSGMFSQVLSVGTHMVTLQAVDSDNNVGTTSITLYIVP
jgi:hypothetical protein